MKLQEYVKMRKMTISEAAKFFNVSYMTFWNWLTGKRRPTLDMAIEIELLTKRVVRCIDWKKEPFSEKRAHRKVNTLIKKKTKQKMAKESSNEEKNS